MTTRFMDTARARTQAGAALWVPADRLGSTLTQAAPAAPVPTTAIAVLPVEAMSSVAAIHRKKPVVTTAFSESRCSWRGIDSAPTTAPMPKLADNIPKPPAPSPNWSRAMTGSSAHRALAQTLKLRLRLSSERIAGECRV